MFKRIRRQMKKLEIQKNLEKDCELYQRKFTLLEDLVYFYEKLNASGNISEAMERSLSSSIEELSCDLCKVEADIHAAQFELEMF